MKNPKLVLEDVGVSDEVTVHGSVNSLTSMLVTSCLGSEETDLVLRAAILFAASELTKYDKVKELLNKELNSLNYELTNMQKENQ